MVARTGKTDSALIPGYKNANRVIISLIKTLEIEDDTFSTTILRVGYVGEVSRKAKTLEPDVTTMALTVAFFWSGVRQ